MTRRFSFWFFYIVWITATFMSFWYFEQYNYSAILGAIILFLFSYFMQGASVSSKVNTPNNLDLRLNSRKRLKILRANLNLLITICLLGLYYWWRSYPALIFTGLFTNFLLFLFPPEKFFDYIVEKRSR